MDAYIKKVRDAALKRDGAPIYNGSIDHASVLAAAMFEFASKDICILSGNLDARVYGRESVLENTRIFLSSPERKVRVIVENPEEIDASDHPFLRAVGSSDDVEIRKISKNHQSVKFHFIVMDDDSYRFEEDKTTPSAVAAFGDPVGGKNLRKVFDHLWNEAESVDLQKNEATH